MWSTAEMQDGSLTNAIAAAAPKLFSSIGEPRSLARKAEQVIGNSHFAEAAGRSWFAAGDNARAIGALRIAAQDTGDDRVWVRELRDRCAAFADLIENDHRSAVDEQQRVVESTRAALQLL
jgi:hypothetical protein